LYGLEFRVGRYISIPDIEAQLAPNNLTYTHSLTYAWDNYTNQGVVASLQVTKQLLLQLGVTDGTETPIWNYNVRIRNQYNPTIAAAQGYNGPDLLYPESSYLKDPGNQPSLTACLRYTWNDGWDNIYPCLDGINQGNWGYNNIQWHGFTYYHKFNDQWHIDFESYLLTGNGIPNLNNPVALAIVNAGGTPFSPQNVPRNSTNLVSCKPSDLTCDVYAVSALTYLNYSPDALNNISLRLEWYDDANGWRTGVATKYFDTGLSWQHWFSPQIEVRPEVTYWHSFDAPAFNGNPAEGISPTRKDMFELASDIIIHF